MGGNGYVCSCVCVGMYVHVHVVMCVEEEHTHAHTCARVRVCVRVFLFVFHCVLIPCTYSCTRGQVGEGCWVWIDVCVCMHGFQSQDICVRFCVCERARMYYHVAVLHLNWGFN